QWSLRIIIEDSEQRTNNERGRRQVAADRVQDQQRVVAVGASRDVVHSHHARRTIITGCSSRITVEVELRQNVVWSNDLKSVIELRECDGAEVGPLAARKLDVLIADQEVEPDRETIHGRSDGDYEPGGAWIQIRGQEAGRLVLCQTNEGVSSPAVRRIYKKQVDGDGALTAGVGDVDARIGRARI